MPSKNISQKQWSTLAILPQGSNLELKKPGLSSTSTIQLQGPGLKNIIAHGTCTYPSRVIEEY